MSPLELKWTYTFGNAYDEHMTLWACLSICCISCLLMAKLFRRHTLKSRPTAIPKAAETEVELWPAPNGSYSLSLLFVNPTTMRCFNQSNLYTQTAWLLNLKSTPQKLASIDGQVFKFWRSHMHSIFRIIECKIWLHYYQSKDSANKSHVLRAFKALCDIYLMEIYMQKEEADRGLKWILQWNRHSNGDRHPNQ